MLMTYISTIINPNLIEKSLHKHPAPPSYSKHPVCLTVERVRSIEIVKHFKYKIP
jgi:hypothetical protein